MKRIFGPIILATALVGWLAFAAHAIYRAKTNLVTLNVRRMDVRRVVRKIEWQTWETILVQTNLAGTVTLNVKNMPLEKVLALIADQTSSRSASLFPLYTSSESLASLKKILQGEAASNIGWTNLQASGGGRRPFRGSPGGNSGVTNHLVSLQITARDLNFTTLAFSRFANVRVIPEDGTTATVSLSFNNSQPTDAVAALARKTNRQWTQLYTLHREFGPSGSPRMAAGNANPRGPRGSSAEAPSDEAIERRAERDAFNEQLLESLPDDERVKMEQAQVERQKEFQEMENMTPEQRRARMAQRGGPGSGSNRSLERLKNSTPEQRAAQRRQMALRNPSSAPQFSRQ